MESTFIASTLCLFTLLVGTHLGHSEDIRDEVSKGEELAPSPHLIPPDQSILGFAIGASEDELLDKLDLPKAYIRLDAQTTALSWDFNTAYLFTNEKLSGVRTGHGIIDHALTQEFSEPSIFRGFFSQKKWRLNNGLTEGMSLTKVTEILGDKLKQDSLHGSKYHQFYETEHSVVHFYFSSMSGQKDKDSAYSIHGLMVIPKK